MNEGFLDDELTRPQMRALLHVYDYSFSPFRTHVPFQEDGKFAGLDFVQWFDLYARGLIRKDGLTFELTTEGVLLLAYGCWL